MSEGAEKLQLRLFRRTTLDPGHLLKIGTLQSSALSVPTIWCAQLTIDPRVWVWELSMRAAPAGRGLAAAVTVLPYTQLAETLSII